MAQPTTRKWVQHAAFYWKPVRTRTLKIFVFAVLEYDLKSITLRLKVVRFFCYYYFLHMNVVNKRRKQVAQPI